jgi:septum formation protein
VASSSLPRIYLASRSPRRRELLKQIGVPFEVLLFREHGLRGRDLDESPREGETPDTYVQRVTSDKAEAGWLRVVQRTLPRLPVLAADTAVCLGDTIFGKPADRADAIAMLQQLSGREHRVLTAVALKYDSGLDVILNQNIVRFRQLSEAEIREYVETGEPFDKAGAYAIQGRAASFIPEILGSYTGVMGLPLYETATLLRKFQTRSA